MVEPEKPATTCQLCQLCQQPNPGHAAYCGNCGAQFTDNRISLTQDILLVTSAVLLVLFGLFVHQEYDLMAFFGANILALVIATSNLFLNHIVARNYTDRTETEQNILLNRAGQRQTDTKGTSEQIWASSHYNTGQATLDETTAETLD